MGVRSGLLIYSDGDVVAELRRPAPVDADATAELVRLVHPGYGFEAVAGSTLAAGTYPDVEVIHAARLPHVDVLSDRRFVGDRPSCLPEHLVRLGAGRRMILHNVHGVIDSLDFAVWEDGELVRSLSLTPGDGIVENIGEPLDFELPYWAGDRPVTSDGGKPYPLPFHPLDLGDEALRSLCGYVLDTARLPTDIDAHAIDLLGFRAVDPSGAERAREAFMRELTRELLAKVLHPDNQPG